LIGIDIGTDSIKVCKITKMDEKNGISVFTAMQKLIGYDAELKKIVLRNLIKKIKVENDVAFLSIGGSSIINRDVILSKNKVNSKDLKKYVFDEVQNSVTEDLSSMYTSYSITREYSNKEMCVLFSAVNKKMVNSAISLFSDIENISVVGVTMETLALANSFIRYGNASKDSESILLLNIGSEVTNVVVLNNNEIVFVKDVDFGGKTITKEISNVYIVPERLAEELKIRADLREQINFNMKTILKRSASSLVETIFRTIEYCVTRQYILSVDRIVITGGGVLTDDLESFIEETLGIRTEKWNILDNNKIVGYSSKDHGFFIPIAFGLALEKEIK